MLSVDRVDKSYRKAGMFSKERQHVLRDISFACGPGECLGIIGESGSGKSTVGRLLLGIEKPDRGTIVFDGKRVDERKARWGKISAVFQDYTSSINPFYTVEQALLEPLKSNFSIRGPRARIQSAAGTPYLSMLLTSKYAPTYGELN